MNLMISGPGDHRKVGLRGEAALHHHRRPERRGFIEYLATDTHTTASRLLFTVGHILKHARPRITDSILRSARSCIPLTTLRSRWSSHPKLNDRSVALVDAKRAAEGAPLEKETTLACSVGLAAAYYDYTARTVQKVRCLRPASKLWWKKAKEVMKHEAQVSSIPALNQDQRGRLGVGCAGQGQLLR